MISPFSPAQTAFLTCLSLWSLLIAGLAWERRRHERNLALLPLRIHVNGTRGKSGVTRLIAAGLRAGGFRPLAKVTGSEAKIIAPDGSEKPVPRRGPANIREYLGTMNQAAAYGADALISECMALQPDLQTFCEHRLMRSHIGVITNVRRDHEEIMGNDLPAIAATIARTVPENGWLVTTPETAALLRGAGALYGREQALRIADSGTLLPHELEAFPFEVEADNVALALKVCELAGVQRGRALEGMCSSQPDVGNLTVREYRVNGRALRLVDALAANDPDSTRILWNRYVGERSLAAAVFINSRADRKLRTRTLCQLLAGLHSGPYYLAGDTEFAMRCLRHRGVPEAQMTLIGEPTLQNLLQAVATSLPCEQTDPDRGTAIFAAGNRKGFVV